MGNFEVVALGHIVHLDLAVVHTVAAEVLVLTYYFLLLKKY